MKLKDQWQTVAHLNASCTSLKTNKARASFGQDRYIRRNLVSSSRRGEKTPHKEKNGTKTKDQEKKRDKIKHE